MNAPSPSRRSFLRATAGAAVGAGALSARAGAQETASERAGTDLAAWFANTENASEVVDERGRTEVTVGVGAEGNGGSFAFAPAAVRVDPGTTVTWEWTGDGSHNVAAEDGSFESEYHGDAGATFSHTPSERGVVRYACTPHEAMGMKGALVVGDADISLAVERRTETAGRTFDGWLANTDNYADVVDERGRSEVVVDVGVDGNGGAFGFGPPAVRVDPDTTVVWRWKGTGGSHSVAALDGSFASDLASERGYEYARTFEEEGVVKYGCEPHAALGMRGVVVVDDGQPNGLLAGADAGLIAGAATGLAVLLSPLGLAAAMHANGSGDPPPRRGASTDADRTE